MENKEFNLSVLENVTTFVSPLKNTADYETILGLIKEEVDINTEDETESQKAGKRPYFGTKRKESESCDSEIVFKSPHKRNWSLRLKSPGSLLKKRRTHELQENNRLSEESNPQRARSLGAIRPGRSLQTKYRKNRSSISHSSEISSLSDFGDNNPTEAEKIISENGEQTESEAEDKTLVIEEAGGAKPGDGNTGGSNRAEPVSLTPEDPLSHGKTQDNDFIEDSQSAVSSELRRKLVNRRSTVENKSTAETKMIEGARENGVTESEEDGENFFLTFSSKSKSHESGCAREASQTPRRPGKRRASKITPTKVSTPKQQKLNSTSVELPRGRESKAILTSPLDGLTQELENCITSSDYEQMSEEIQTDVLERTSFTFETIEFLSQYEETDQQANNQILSKILSSPAGKINEESADSSEIAVGKVQPTEDPLYIDENKRDIAPTISKRKSSGTTRKSTKRKSSGGAQKSTKRKSSEEARKSTKKKSIVAKILEEPTRRSARLSLIEESETKENTAPETSEGKHTTKRAFKERTRKSTELEKLIRSEEPSSPGKSPLEENEMNESEVKRSTRKATEENMRESIKVENPEEDNKRHSARLKTTEPEMVDLSDLEDDEDLVVQAANVSKKVEAAEKRAVLSEKTLKKLNNLVVRLRHEVLPQHEIESRAGSKPLSYEQQQEFVQLAQLNKETYSPAEDEIIKANWNYFCDDHNWNPKDYKPFLSLKHGDKLIMSNLEERRKFVQFLADGLPNRPLCSVYNRFKILYGRSSTTGSRYTSEEDMEILAYMLYKPAENPDKKCSELARVLNRSRESIWKRYKKLVEKYCREDEKKVLTKVEWNLPLAQEFITTLIDVTLSEDLTELKDAFIPKVVWLKMEKKMKIDHQLLKRFWEQQLHLQLFSEEPLYLNKIKVTLIEHMYTEQICHPAEIKWQRILRNFDGLTTSFLRKVFNHLTMKTSMKLHSRNLKRILKWLYTKKINQLMSEPKDKCLPRIFYKDKKAEFHREDIETIQSCSESLKIH